MNEFAFRSLHTLRLINTTQLEYGFFRGLNSLTKLSIKKSLVRRFDGSFFTNIVRSLSDLKMVSSFYEKTINNLTANGNLSSLNYFHLESTEFPLGVLSARNISGLTNITELKLIRCGIEAIEETTFDLVCETLKRLCLDNNHLRTLSDLTFDSLLHSDVLSISLTGNPWHCDKNITSIKAKFSIFFNDDRYFDPNCTRCVNIGIIPPKIVLLIFLSYSCWPTDVRCALECNAAEHLGDITDHLYPQVRNTK